MLVGGVRGSRLLRIHGFAPSSVQLRRCSQLCRAARSHGTCVASRQIYAWQFCDGRCERRVPWNDCKQSHCTHRVVIPECPIGGLSLWHQRRCVLCMCVCVAYTSATTKVLFCGSRLSAADPVYMILWISVICGVSHTFTSSTCIHTVPTRWSFLVIRVFTSFVFSCRHRIKQSV